MTISLSSLKSAFNTDNSQNSDYQRYYPFYRMNDGEQATIRFLPDVDKTNPMGFLIEKLTHTLLINGEKKSIPCLQMYGDDCPICNVSRAYYKEKDEINGKKYWRNKAHLAQAIVVEDPLPADQQSGVNAEGEVKIVSLGYQLFKIIKHTFESGELDELPFAQEGGTDFIISKSKQGDYSTYTVGSNFVRRSTDLTPPQIAIAETDSIELKTLLPKKPELATVEAMLSAALSGASYVEASNAPAAKPVSTEAPSNPFPETGTTSTDAPIIEQAPTATVTPPATGEEYTDEAQRILAEIRSRKT